MALMLGHSFEIAEDVSLSLSADCWYVVQTSDSELDDGFACADYTAKISYKWLSAFATYVQQLDDDVLPDGGRTTITGEDGTVSGSYNWGYDAEWILGVCFDLAL